MARGRLRARVNWWVRWGGAAVCAAILVVCVATLPWAFYVGRLKGPDGWTLAVWRGQVILLVNEFDPSRANLGPGLIPPETSPRKWTFGADRSRANRQPDGFPSPMAFRSRQTPNLFGWTYEGFFPLWPAFVVSLVCSWIAWARRGRSVILRPCASCRYDLSGLPPGSACPECGAVSGAPERA
jgi:hypothetical protein